MAKSVDKAAWIRIAERTNLLAEDVLRFVADVYDDARTGDPYGLFGQDWGTDQTDEMDSRLSKGEEITNHAERNLTLKALVGKLRQPLALASNRVHEVAGLSATSAHELVSKLACRIFNVMEDVAQGRRIETGFLHEGEFQYRLNTSKVIQNLDKVREAIHGIPQVTGANANHLLAEVQREYTAVRTVLHKRPPPTEKAFGRLNTVDSCGNNADRSDRAPERRRPAYARDHLWFKWSQTDGLTPASIRDRWNSMTDKERREICPRKPEKIENPDSHDAERDLIKKALKKAESESCETGEN